MVGRLTIHNCNLQKQIEGWAVLVSGSTVLQLQYHHSTFLLQRNLVAVVPLGNAARHHRQYWNLEQKPAKEPQQLECALHV
jgi:hypothetical protein